MAYRLLLVDDEAPDVVDLILKPFVKDHTYEIAVQTQLDDIQWEVIDGSDIILIDYFFRDKRTGIEFLNMLRRERPGLQTPLIMLSMASEMKEVEWKNCLYLGIKDFISKSTPPEIIKRKISSLIEGEVYRRQCKELKEALSIEEAESSIASLDYGLISSLVPEAKDWEYMSRIILKTGPIHRQESNGIFLAIFHELLSLSATKMQKEIGTYPYETVEACLQEPGPPPHHFGRKGHSAPLPPHLGERFAISSSKVPLGLPSRLLSMILKNNDEKVTRAGRHLLTGPPHEVFMNILLLHICETLYQTIR